MEVCKLNKAEVRALRDHLAGDALANYELLWVLESSLSSPSWTVLALGQHPWPGGVLIDNCHCTWIRIREEMLLTRLLEALPARALYRFYAISQPVLDMLRRWFPDGTVRETGLWVRNVTKSWRKRFDVRIEPVANGPARCYAFRDNEGRQVALAGIEQVVPPWWEVVHWQLTLDQDLLFWQQQVFGTLADHALSAGQPLVVRVEDRQLEDVLNDLGYRHFSPLYYYVAAGNQ